MIYCDAKEEKEKVSQLDLHRDIAPSSSLSPGCHEAFFILLFIIPSSN